MRIAVDARPLAAPLTGIGRYSWELLRELTQSNHEWLLYSSTPVPWESLARENVSCRQGKAKPASIASVVSAQLEYSRWLRQDGADLFWSPRHHLPLIMPDNVRTAVTIHDVVYRRFPKSMTTGGRFVERLLMPPSVRKADGIICVSAFTRSELTHFWPETTTRSRVIHSGTSQFASSQGNQEALLQRDFILSVGTPEPRKNLVRLLQAFASLVQEQGITEDLVIVGDDGWGSVNLRDTIQQLQLAGRVRLQGKIGDEELAALYQHARCLVVPSVYEGFGLPVAEAMQYGLPAVVAEGGALAEVAGDSALLCDPLSVSSIAQSILRMLRDDSLRQGLASRALERGGLFNWQICARKTLALLESL